MVAALLTGAVLGGGVTAAYAGTIDSANGFYTYTTGVITSTPRESKQAPIMQ
jgi:hypothetical protein